MGERAWDERERQRHREAERQRHRDRVRMWGLTEAVEQPKAHHPEEDCEEVPDHWII